MIGYRKLILGCAFLLVSGFLTWRGIENGTDLLSLSTPIGAMAGGLFGVVWGNVRDKKADSK